MATKKMWVDKCSEFYNRSSMNSRLQNNDKGIYSTCNEGIYVFAKRFIRTLKDKIYKCRTSISKNKCIDKLDDIGNEYNNTYRIIKMRPGNVKSSTYIDFNAEKNDKDPKWKSNVNIKMWKLH